MQAKRQADRMRDTGKGKAIICNKSIYSLYFLTVSPLKSPQYLISQKCPSFYYDPGQIQAMEIIGCPLLSSYPDLVSEPSDQ